MICKCERNITNRIYYDSKEKERCITCTRYIHMADVVTFNIVKKETKNSFSVKFDLAISNILFLFSLFKKI